jgi:hypothetical protein
MKTYRARLKSAAGLLFNRGYEHEVERNQGESFDDYERRTWQNRAHVNEDGFVTIPAIFFKNAIHEAAAYRSDKLRGNKTYTKVFQGGVTVYEPLVTAYKPADCKAQSLYVPTDGRHGSGKRVWKTFPVVHKWEGLIEIIVMDEQVTHEVLLNTLQTAGMFIGIGGRRPANRGDFGRFTVVSLEEARQPEALAV